MKRYLLKVVIAAFILFPFGFLLMLSLGRQWVFPSVGPQIWTLANWRALWYGQSGLAYSLLISVLISGVIATVVTLLSFVTSRQLAYSRRRWLVMAYFPYVFAPVILAACLQYFFIRSGLSGSVGGVILAQLFITYPFGLILFSGFWNEHLRSMEQLVATLGGNRMQTYRRVLLPVARGALLVCFFQTFLISWFEYGLTMLIGVGKVQTLTVKVFMYINEANIFLAALASLLLAAPPAVLLYLNKRYIFSKVI